VKAWGKQQSKQIEMGIKIYPWSTAAPLLSRALVLQVKGGKILIKSARYKTRNSK